ncbi:MAG TPA: NAD(P)H-binding protein, partial [Gemmatimonadota bacterium]|nr:NAD(P)H-binding protein [Gemmatimonadota bacterium]
MNASPTPRSVLVAGGTGFLGAAIVRELQDRGHRVVVLSRHPDSVQDRFPGRAVGARAGDVTDPRTLARAFDGIDAVVQSVQFP